MQPTSSRKTFIQQAAVGLGMLGLPASALGANAAGGGRPLRIVCVGAHPDDPESGAGGTLAKLAAAGHSVTIVYFTRGEAGIPGRSNEDAAAIRTAEATAACRLLGAKPVFAGQVDGASVVTNEWVARMERVIADERPDIVFSHWPIDSHKDHQCASLLTIQAWMRATPKFDLYFFEVCSGSQTIVFQPTDYVDITGVLELKHKAVFCHESQNPAEIYRPGTPGNHAVMEEYRGIQIGVKAAEAFVRMVGQGQGDTIAGLQARNPA
jgi:LmbE family N-acetylglucosaminyl deacetylase